MKVNVSSGHKWIGRGTSLRSGRLGRIFARYRDARKSMRVSISRQSQHGLDWMNFFLADVQTGFGAFVAFYLADLGWAKDQVGMALTAGTLAGVLCQAPGSCRYSRLTLTLTTTRSTPFAKNSPQQLRVARRQSKSKRSVGTLGLPKR